MVVSPERRNVLAKAKRSFRAPCGYAVPIGINVFWLASFLISGCKVDQGKEVAHYRRVLDHNGLPGADALPSAEMRVLSLAEAMTLANRRNEQLETSGEDYVQSLIEKNRAVASFLPTVSFQPSYTIQDGSSRNGTTVVDSGGTGTVSSGGGNSNHQLVAPIVGTINVFRGFGDVYNLRAAEAVIAQRRELLLDLQATVLLNVAQTYYQILRSERSVEVLRIPFSSRNPDCATSAFNCTAALRRSSRCRRRARELAATRVQLTQALSDGRNGRSTLAQLIGWHDVPNPLIDDYPVPADRPPETHLEAVALSQRQDLRAAERGGRCGGTQCQSRDRAVLPVG